MIGLTCFVKPNSASGLCYTKEHIIPVRITMANNTLPIVNPQIVLREEFDDWAILFDPDTGDAFGLNPVSVFVWKRLDGRHSVDGIIEELKAECEDVPEDAASHVGEFIKDLVGRGLAGTELPAG
jgi:SynChlorMet cassette protein ScmD